MQYAYPVEVRYVSGYTLEILFENGKTGKCDFSRYIENGTVFERFKDLGFFKQFFIDPSTGVLAWPGRIDIAPETLYNEATGEPFPDWMESDEIGAGRR